MRRSTIKEIYSVKEAMDRLGLKGLKAFLRLERKYPHAFIVVKQTKGVEGRQGMQIHYDKATLDRFAEAREKSRQENP